MNLPKQVAPVNRQATKASRNSKGIAPSGECGCFCEMPRRVRRRNLPRRVHLAAARTIDD